MISLLAIILISTTTMKNWDVKKIGIVAGILIAVAVAIWYVTKHTTLLKKKPAGTTPSVGKKEEAKKMSFASPFVGGQAIEYYQN